MEQDPARRPLRIGDREREAVVGVLQQAVADGRLSLTEFDNRLEVAMHATTSADLEPLVIDLIATPWPLNLAGGPLTRRPGSPGWSREDPLRLDGAENRRGVWTVPPFIQIAHGSRWVTLDFQQAATDSTVIDIDVIGGAGWILLVLPTGWAADVDRLSTGWGSKSVKVPHQPSAGKPTVVIHGAIGAGRLRLRHPNRRDRRVARRRTD